jgi:hypothetical protein
MGKVSPGCAMPAAVTASSTAGHAARSGAASAARTCADRQSGAMSVGWLQKLVTGQFGENCTEMPPCVCTTAQAQQHSHKELRCHACGEAARKRRGECAAATLSPLAVTAASTSSAAHSSSSCLQQGTVQP